MTTPPATLTLTHSAADGTLLDGTSKGDGVGDILRAAPMNWRWGRDLGMWFVRGSRDQPPTRWKIDATATALRAAGWDVDVEIDATPRPTADVEADRAERTVDRVEALDAKADRLTAAGDAAWDAARERASHIPMGQPILVGHHSERGHRRVLAQIDRMEDTAIGQIKEGQDAARRADTAEAHQRHRLSGPVTQRRVEKLEADIRALIRKRDGHTRTLFTYPDGRKALEATAPATGEYRDRIEDQLANAEEQVRHWRGYLTELAESGEFRIWTRADFTKGDFVNFRFGWAKVLRVNAKTLTIPHLHEQLSEGGHTWPLPYDEVRGRRSAEEQAAAEAGGEV